MLDQQHNLFIRYAKKIRNLQHLQKILDRQEQALDFKPFKIENLTPEKALKTYKNLNYRYRVSKQLPPLNNGWYQYEKGLFVWFMVIYTYYLGKEGKSIDTLTERSDIIYYPQISSIFFSKSTLFLEFQFLNLIKTTDKLVWTEIEDALLTAAVRKLPQEKWTEISLEIFGESNKQKFISSKHCRERWHNHLDTTKIKGNWQAKQDLIILQYVLEREGKKWSKMKNALCNRRTEHMIKNRYHSLITKNKLHRNDKEIEIARNLLIKLRETTNAQTVEKPEEFQHVEQENKIFVTNKIEGKKKESNLKEENFSSENESNKNPLPLELPQNQPIETSKVGELQNDKCIKEEEKMREQNLESVYDRHVEQMDPLPQNQQEENIYPFENYNYELEICNYKTQILEFHKNQMMFYQQYMTYNHVIPTAETYMNVMEYQPTGNASIQPPEAPNESLDDFQDNERII